MACDTMTEAQVALWRRVAAFSLDEPGTILPFSQRLARENGWEADFAQRVIEEYKRFVFLATAAGHPVSPPEAVDQVWHLHLVYTESYWVKLCGEVLGRRLHHHPTKGGGDEARKFDDMYEQTLASYRRLFGREAPRDIWPSAEDKRRGKPHPLRWVDPSTHWILPKRAVLPLTSVVGFVAVIGLTSGCDRSALEVFDYSGPHFLFFFVVAVLVGWVVAAIVRHLMCRPHSEPRTEPALSPFEVAYLAGGAKRVMQASLASLVAKDAIELRPEQGGLVVARRDAPAGALDDHEVLLWGALPEDGSAVRLAALEDALRGANARIAGRLERAGLFSAHAHEATMVATAIACVTPVIGMVKIGVGIARDRPVMALLLLWLGATIVTTLIYLSWHRQRRSGRGSSLLKQIKERHAALVKERRVRTDMSPALAVAVFGTTVMADLGLANLEQELKRNGTETSLGGCGTSCGASCGSGCGGCGGGD